MLSLRQFLSEERTKEQMDHLLNYIQRRQNLKKAKPRNFKDFIYKHIKKKHAIVQNAQTNYPYEHARAGTLKRPQDFHTEYKHIPLKSIKVGQTFVGKHNVRHLAHQMADGKFDEKRSPIHVIHDPKTGDHVPINGNNRTFATRLHGKNDTVYAKVSTHKSHFHESLEESPAGDKATKNFWKWVEKRDPKISKTTKRKIPDIFAIVQKKNMQEPSVKHESATVTAALIAAKVGAGIGALAWARHLAKKANKPKPRSGRKVHFQGLSKHVRGILADNPDKAPIRGIGTGPASQRSQIAVFAGKRTPKRAESSKQSFRRQKHDI